MTNQRMNDLYHDFFSNSPQTVNIDIPDRIGRGRITQIVTKHNVVFSDCDMEYFSDMEIEGANRSDFIQIRFCLGKKISWKIEDETFVVDKGESCVYRGHGKVEEICYKKDTNYKIKNVKIPISYFNKIINSYFEKNERKTCMEKLFSGVSKVKITPYMKHIFVEINEIEKFRGGLGYLFLESKIAELLAVYLSEILEIDILASDRGMISTNDKDRISAAKKIIDERLDCAPTCDELAKQLNMSVTRLTRGFSTMYGTSVHAYIIDQRLKKAAVLLVESNMNVSRIGAMVGYTKASNFSAAFKKKYGILPKDYRIENSEKKINGRDR